MQWTHWLHRHKKQLDAKSFAYLACIISTGNAAFWAVFPLLLMETLHTESRVGMYYSLLSIVTFIAGITSTVLFMRLSKVRIAHATFIIIISCLLGLTIAARTWHIVGLDIPRAVCVLFLSTCISLLVYEHTTKKEIAAMQGVYYFYVNIGWLIGPVLGGVTAKYFGNQSIFIVVGVLYTIAYLYFLHLHVVAKNEHIEHVLYTHGWKDIWYNFRDFMVSTELRRVVAIAYGLHVYFAIFYIYMPLHIAHLGYSQGVSGFVLTISVVPLLFLEKRVGVIVQKIGLRTCMAFGFAVIAIALLGYAYWHDALWPLIAVILLASIGIACIEPLQEVYFYRSVSRSNSHRLYGIFNTAKPIANVTGPFIASIAFVTIGGFNGVWYALSAFLFVFVCIALRIPRRIH